MVTLRLFQISRFARVLSKGDKDKMTKRARSLERRVGILEGRVGVLEGRVRELEEEARKRGKVADEGQVKVVGLCEDLWQIREAGEVQKGRVGDLRKR
jgi:hypothetical protein